MSIRESLIMIYKKINFLRRVIKTIRNKQKIDISFPCSNGERPTSYNWSIYISWHPAEKAISPFDPQLSNHIRPSSPPFLQDKSPNQPTSPLLRTIFLLFWEWENVTEALKHAGVKVALKLLPWAPSTFIV